MEVPCPNCGTENPERAKFCLECGAPLAAVAGSRESRRVVTVVFADMVGFTSLGERLDQESLRRVMDRFYAEMRGAIEGQGGTLAKFIGDAVLAVWGTPQVREDDALRAVRAAEGMRRALAGLNRELEERWGVHVGMRTGVNTGEVVVDPSRPADLLVGDTLNVAARLEQAAADGEVLIGADTFQLVRDEAILEPVEPLALKGKSRPLQPWRLIDGSRGDRRTAPRLQAPLVGRDAELNRLRASFAGVVDGRSARMVTVIGSPGLGKTRLVGEFVGSLAAEATVLQGRCEASGEGITFQPVAEVLRMAAAIDEDDTPERAREKLAGVLAEDEPQRERVVDRTAALLGLAPVASTEETFWAVRRLLESLARRRPVVLVHDDIHWGQPTFLDLLEHLVAWVRDAPLLIVALARPELREVRQGLTEAGSVVGDVLELEPLAPAASRTLADRLLGDAQLPPALAERVLETTEGNPLFLGEMLRMLADEGVLRREGDRWVAAGDTAAVAVPPTIQALLSARIERLADDERSVVERAAVIGHQFYRGAVAELAPAPVKPRVDMALDTLRRKDLVRPEDFLWLDEKVFRFHHVLIRDAAYRSLLKESRADLHERFADWLEAKAADMAGEHEEIIAFHLEQAYAYRLELGALDEHGRAIAARAGARLHSAGRRALAREDLPAAINLLRRAIAPVSSDEPGLADILVDLAEALLSAGDTAAAEAVIEQIGLGADEHEDERLGAWATVFLGQLDNLIGAGHVSETLEAVGEAAGILARAGDRGGEAKAHQVVAGAHAQLGQVAAAEAALDRALVAARAADDRRRITAVLSGAPRAALWGPAPIVRASGRCLDVVRILRMTPGNRHVEAAALRCQAVLEAMRGRADAARGILDTCRMTFEELGLTLELCETDVHAGIVELLSGEPAAAEERLRAAHEGFEALGANSGAAQAAALLARALLDQDREADALELSRFAEEHGGEDLKTTIAWLGVRAEALARRGDEHEALILARRGVELAEPTDALADKADALMALAAVELAAGDVEAAREAARRARDLYAQKDHAVGVERAEVLADLSPAPSEPAQTAESGWTPRTPAELVHARWIDAFNQRDWDTIEWLHAPEFQLVSHRPLSDDAVQGTQEALAILRSGAGVGASLRFSLLAASDEVVVGVNTWWGSGEAPAEMLQGVIHVCIDGRLVYAETFDPDDELGMLRRFEALRAEHAEAPMARAAGRWPAAFNAGDAEALLATYTPDYVLTDHRGVGWGVQDREQTHETLMAWKRLSPEATAAYTRTLAVGEGVFAGIMTGAAISPDGGSLRLVTGQVLAFRGDVTATCDMYEPDDEAAMLARFEELCAEHERDDPWLAAHARRDWDALRRLYAEDYTCIDHRGLAWDIVDRDAVIAQQRAVLEIDANYTVQVTVQREAPGVECAHISFGGPEREWEVPFVAVRRKDGDVIVSDDIFAADDEEAIAARFEELVRESRLREGAAGRVYLRWVEIFNARDWDSVPTVMAQDGVMVDHRTVGWEEMDVAKLYELWQTWVATAPDVRLRIARVDAVSDHAAALVLTGRGSAEGSEFELEFGILVEQRDGLISRVEVFDPEDADALRAGFERLTGKDTRPAPLRFYDAFCQAINARDWDAARALFPYPVIQVDRRLMGWEEMQGGDSVVELIRTFAEAAPDLHVWVDRVLRVSDDAVAMVFGGVGTDENGSRAEILVGQLELFQDGASVYVELYEPDGEDERMLARYEELTRPAVRAVHPMARVFLERITRAFNERDWQAYRSLFTEDFHGRDLRLVAETENRGPDETVEVFKGVVDVMPEVQMSAEVLAGEALAGGLRLSASVWTFRSGDTSEVRVGSVGVSREGKSWQTHVLDDDPEALLAHYDAVKAELLGDGSERPGFPGRITAACDAWTAAMNARDWDRIVRFLAPDIQLVDRRPVVNQDLEGIDAFLELLKSIMESAPSMSISWEPRAYRAEWLIALRATLVGTDESGGAFEGVFDQIIATGPDGRSVHHEVYEPDDEAALLARLDELEREGPPPPLVERVGRRFTGDSREMTELLRSVGEVGGQVRFDQETVAVRGERHRLASFAFRGEDERGGPFEIAGLFALEVGEDGRIHRVEVFESDDEGARARLDELAGPHACALAPLAEPGATTAGVARWVAALNAHDLDAIALQLADDYGYEDLRPGLGHSGDRATTLASWRSSFAEIPDLQVDMVVLAAEGQVCHVRERWTANQGAHEIHILTVAELDAGGRLCRAWIYEPDDPAAWDRYAELVRSRLEAPLVERTSERWGDAFAARDLDAIAALYRPDAVFVDRRPLAGPDARGSEGFRDLIASVVEMGVDTRHEGEMLLVVGERLGLMRNRYSGHDERGGAWAVEVLILIEVDDDGRLVRGEVYTPEQEPEARTRLAELAETRGERQVFDSERLQERYVLRDGRAHHNEYLDPEPEAAILERFRELAATRSTDPSDPAVLTQRYVAAVNTRDVEAIGDLCAEDLVYTDHRAGLRHEIRGRTEAMDPWAQLFADVPDLVAEADVLRAADGVALVRMGYRGHRLGVAEYEIVQDQVSTARDGVIRTTDVYEAGDPAATKKFDSWVAHRRQARFQQEVLSAHDWDRAREEVFAEDFSQTDHRRAVGAETIQGGAKFLDHLRQTWEELVPDTTIAIEVVAVDGDRRVSKTTYRGHLTDGGGEAELVLWTVATIDGLRNLRGDIYEDEQAARAALAAPDAAATDRAAFALAEGVYPSGLTELYCEWTDAINRHDLDALARTFAEDFRHEDHRPGVRHVMQGRDEVLAAYRDSFSGSRDLRIRSLILAATEEVAHARVEFYGARGRFEIEQEMVSVVRDGVSRSTDVYEAGDPAAVDCYEAWVAHLRQARFQSQVLTAHDWERAATELFAEDFSQIDHRPVGAPPISGGAAYAEQMRKAFELAPDAIAEVDVLAVDGNRRVSRLVYRGHWEKGGGEGEVVMFTVTEIDGLRNLRSDLYATAEEALAALAEPPGPPAAKAPVVQAYERLTAAFDRRDWEAVGAQVTDDFAWADERPKFAEARRGREAFVDWARHTARGDVRWTFDTVEVRGSAQLARIRFSGSFRGGPYENVMYDVHAIGPDGRFTESHTYEELEEAMARLEDLAAPRAPAAGG